MPPPASYAREMRSGDAFSDIQNPADAAQPLTMAPRAATILRAVAAAGAVALAMASFAGAATPRSTTVDLKKTKATQPGNQVHIAGTILPRAAANPKQGSGSIAVVTIAVNGKKVTPTSLGNAIQPAPNGTFVYKAIVGLGAATYRVTFTPPFNGKWRKSAAVVTVTMSG